MLSRFLFSMLFLAAGCASDDGVADPVDAGGDANRDAGLEAPAEAGSSDEAGGSDATRDSSAQAFMAIAPCLTPESYVTGASFIATEPTSYRPPCLRVPAGTSVAFEASVAHPLEPRANGSAGNPIPNRFDTTTVTFSRPGFFPYQCPEHIDQGMTGVVWVAP